MTERFGEGTAKVSLTAEEWNRAGYFGNKRTEWNRANGTRHNPAYEGINFKVKGAAQDTLGVATEFAVIKFLGLDPRGCGWVPFSTNKADFKTPDIQGVIDVRRVTEPGNPLRVYAKDALVDAIVVKTYVDGSDVYILGWRYATEVVENLWSRQGNAYVSYRLEDADTLHKALEGRLGRVSV